MLSDARLQFISSHPEENEPEAVSMARELLRYRSALAQPWAVVEGLGVKYVEDGNGAMIWPARYCERGDTLLYRLDQTASEVSGRTEAAEPVRK
ncbi:hypothetical protein ACOMDP_08635 [Pantoea dispersa]|uniref:hypothetical protein n=1 Tax=Pantoea dispersa TaxID=59814 RepID=UPI003B78D21A